MKLKLLILAMSYTMNIRAQDVDPKLTEVWNPSPRKVSFIESNNIPSDAIILFDGKNLDKWVTKDGFKDAKWKINEGSLMVISGEGDIKTKEKFGSCQLHLEFKTPSIIESEGQGRGNSGVFFQERYEVQILDSYENVTYSNGQCASIYKQHIPLVNACKAPGEWQSYDIIFMEPEFNSDGIKIKHGSFTVFHNGVIVQNNVDILGTTEYRGWPQNNMHGDGSIILQDHGNAVSFRNIWLRKL
jgi:hypothetical protein